MTSSRPAPMNYRLEIAGEPSMARPSYATHREAQNAAVTLSALYPRSLVMMWSMHGACYVARFANGARR